MALPSYSNSVSIKYAKFTLERYTGSEWTLALQHSRITNLCRAYTLPTTPIMSVRWPRKLTLSLSSIQRLHCRDTQYWVDVNVTTLYCQLFLYTSYGRTLALQTCTISVGHTFFRTAKTPNLRVGVGVTTTCCFCQVKWR